MYHLFYELVPLRGAPGEFYRHDTRLYFHPKACRPVKGGICKGVIWMCNPGDPVGAARRSAHGWLPADLDLTLIEVFKIFRAALLTKYKGTAQMEDFYLQIMNLFYVVNSDPKLGYTTWLHLKPAPPIESIPRMSKFIWLAWGHSGIVTSRIQRHFFPDVQKELNKSSLSYFYLDNKGGLHTPVAKTPVVSFKYALHPLRFRLGPISARLAVAHMAGLL